MDNIDLAPLLELGNGKSVKACVIRFLSEEWPLNVRKLHAKVEQQRPGVSYHAVHKAVQQLVREGVLKRERTGYLLDAEWIEHVHAFVHGIRARQQPGGVALPSLKDLKDGDSRTFVFETLAEADAYRKKLQLEYCSKPNARHPYCGIAMHLRTPVVYSESSFSVLSALAKSDLHAYLVVAGQTPIDEWCADYYRNEFVRVQTGVSIPTNGNCEMMILGDVVTQIYIPDKIQQIIRDVYARAKNISEINVPEFYRSVYLSPEKVRFVVSKNAEIAHQLRHLVLNHFNMKQVAVFDLDFVILNPAFFLDVASELYKSGLIQNSHGNALLTLCEKFKKGKITKDEFANKALVLCARAVGESKPQDVKCVAANFLRSNMQNYVYTFSLRLLNLVRSFCKVVTITRLPQEIADGISEMLPVDVTLTSEIGAKNGAFTGKAALNIELSNARHLAFEDWLRSEGSYAYGLIGFGGCYHDYSAFLKCVKFPFVISPDKKLAERAKCNHWPIYTANDGRKLLEKVRNVLSSLSRSAMRDTVSAEAEVI
ncbi:MAG: hypothetical protein QXF55_01835 [Candidatus Aenigmatarchaeota archaeon]